MEDFLKDLEKARKAICESQGCRPPSMDMMVFGDMWILRMKQ